ncbi:cyclin-dependent kinase 2-associated protein 1-like [Ptychodera flava]|uniref:cyclin-dependent kinase 2-associated protein 1-like n=1 Tax=Ptychodera flava TaxID=63121 RepID=UPI00396A86D1
MDPSTSTFNRSSGGAPITFPSLTAQQLQNLQSIHSRQAHPQSKYAELLAVIEDMGRDMRPTYAGSKSSTERLKRGIVHARALVRECLAEAERSARM